jgi:hypothetical protein
MSIYLNVVPVDVFAFLKAKPGRSARDVSFFLLDQVAGEEDFAEGESADDNLALRVIEEALDWSIGMKVLGLLQAYAKIGKRPKPFTLKVGRGGVMTATWPSGHTLNL